MKNKAQAWGFWKIISLIIVILVGIFAIIYFSDIGRDAIAYLKDAIGGMFV